MKTKTQGRNDRQANPHDWQPTDSHGALLAQGKPELPEHSPLPWERYGMTIGNKEHPVLAGAFNSFDAEVGGRRITDKIEIADDEALANAKLIVASVNHAEALAEALRERFRLDNEDPRRFDYDHNNQNAWQLDSQANFDNCKQALADWEKAKQ